MARRELHSRRFGVLTFEDDELFHFPGLPGFPEAKRFLVRHHDRDTPFAWLICADTPELAFVVADPWVFVPEYQPELQPEDWKGLGVSEESSLQILVIAKPDEKGLSLNLAAPLLIGVDRRTARQVILRDSRYETRCHFEWAPDQTESNPHR